MDCEISLLPVESCTHCLGLKPEPKTKHTYRTAQRAFPCDACGDTILVGDKFRAWKNGHKHAGCTPVRSSR